MKTYEFCLTRYNSTDTIFKLVYAESEDTAIKIIKKFIKTYRVNADDILYELFSIHEVNLSDWVIGKIEEYSINNDEFKKAGNEILINYCLNDIKSNIEYIKKLVNNPEDYVPIFQKCILELL